MSNRFPVIRLRITSFVVLSVALLTLQVSGVQAQKTVERTAEPVPVVRSFQSGSAKGPIGSKQQSFFSAPAVVPKPLATSFTNATGITITDCPNPCPASGQAASLYPSPITVSGEVGVVQRVSVTLNGFSHAFPADLDF